MHEAVPDAHSIRDAHRRPTLATRHTILLCASLLVTLLTAPRALRAQLPPSPVPPSNAEDARTLPKGTVMLRVLNAWTRFDEVYDAKADSAQHLHPLGNAFSADSVGVRQYSTLAGAQAALRTLTQNPSLNLNIGQQSSTVDTRIVTTPISLSYGLTDRLTVGAMVPIVQTHSTVFVQLNPSAIAKSTGANVGPNAALLGLQTAAVTNQQLITQLGQAVAAMQSFVSNCGTSCSQSTLDLRDKTAAFYAATQLLYGMDSKAGQFSPLANSAEQTAINAQLTKLQNDVNQTLGSSFNFVSPIGASAPAALLQLQQLATAPTGVALDSLGSPDRLGIGDIELSARYKLIDGFADTSGGVRVRASLQGVVQLPTGGPPSGTLAYEVGTGTGQTNANVGAIVDLRLTRRFLSTFAGYYTAYLTSASIERVPNSDYALFPLGVPVAGTWREGNAIQVEATPRFQVTDYFLLHAAYAMRHQAGSQYTSPDITAPPLFDATTEQRLGVGFSFSTVARYARGRSSVPFELFFTHLETITASGGLVPKYSRDQVEMRIYYRLRRGGR